MTTIVRYPQQRVSALNNGCVATIGKFDGLHLGHQAMLKRLLQFSQVSGLPSVVIMFEPYPSEFFKGGQAPARLTQLRDQYHYLNEFGIDYLIFLRFNRAMATMPPEQFVTHYLQDLLNVRQLIVGNDFRFGYRRQGDVALLKQLLHGQADVDIAQDYQLDGVKVSSSLIRSQLQNAKLDQVQRYLGRHYTITARVVHGEKRGRTINFPTINIPLKRRLALQYGVYAVRVSGVLQQPIDGVASIGIRPVVNGKQPILEVYLFDFDRYIYGHLVSVSFYGFIRPEWYFPNLEALQQQIRDDCQQAKTILQTK